MCFVVDILKNPHYGKQAMMNTRVNDDVFMAMLSFSFNKSADTNQREKLKNALEQAGWTLAATAGFQYEGASMAPIWIAMEACAKQCAAIGPLSHLSINVMRKESQRMRNGIASARCHPYALDQIRQKRFPMN